MSEIDSLRLFILIIFIQTLSILHLENNEIGDRGAQSLSSALKDNHVRDILWSSLSSFGIIDTHNS